MTTANGSKILLRIFMAIQINGRKWWEVILVNCKLLSWFSVPRQPILTISFWGDL